MRICLVTPYGLDRVSGITAVLTDLAAELTARGHTTSVIAPDSLDRSGPPHASAWLVPVREPFRNLSLAYGTARALWSNRGLWDGVHVHQGHPQTLAATLIARLLGRSAVATLHLMPPPAKGLRGLVERGSTRMLLAMATDRVFVSRDTQAAFGSTGAIIPNGTRVEAIRRWVHDRDTLRRELRLSGFVIAFAGRKARIKGYLDLLHALRSVRQDGTDARLLVTGDAPREERSEIEKTLRELDVEPWVLDLGSRDDHIRLLAAADAFALPSYREGMPMAVLEAMAAGLPVVATRVGGVPEMIADGQEGFLVTPGDVPALASRLRQIASDPALARRMKANAEQRAGTFDVSRMTSAYIEIYSRHGRRLV